MIRPFFDRVRMCFAKNMNRIIFIIICALTLFVARPASDENYIFSGDDLRYISYAVALHEYGVFGSANKNHIDHPPSPDNMYGPLYPFLLAGVMKLDQELAESLICVNRQGVDKGCPQNFDIIFITQSMLALLSLFLIYMLAYYFSGYKSMGWLAGFLALASGVFQEFSFLLLTENIALPAFCALLLSCLLLYQRGDLRFLICIGVTLGILTLTRPSHLYLFYSFALVFAGLWVFQRRRRAGVRLLVLVAVFTVCVAPWAVRNKLKFDSYTLTSGGYAEYALITRTNYNQMSWPEVGVAMIYWLPDFGDSLAREIFPQELHVRLGWDQGTYYAQDHGKQIETLSRDLGGHDKVLQYLVREEVLSLKHIAVSVPLAVRGTFVAKYWGLVGFIAFVALGIYTVRRKNYALLVIAAPLFFMVAFYAGVSASIPRYNLPLITLYALSMAWYIRVYGTKLIRIFYKK